jgi:site-specific DNA-cytosine methylase
MDILRMQPPRHLVLENVEGFLGSDAHALLCARIADAGMERLELRLCPTAFGVPNQRPRVFIVASRAPLAERALPGLPPAPLAAFLDAEEDAALYLDAAALAKHGPGLDLVRPDDRRSTCFIGGYGQRFVASGSFLQTERGVRRFSPGEIGRLMGLPVGFRFPPEVPLEQRYKLLGNGLSIPVARWVLGCLEAPGAHG